jgi:ABC-type nitrate/sulfonate/bicarbonate transport system substrate-binding protein
MITKKFWIGIIILICIVLIGGGVWYLQNSQQKYSGPTESVVVGTPPLELSALIYIAQDQNFFADNGLNVTIKNYDSGLNAVNGLIASEVDIAAGSEFVLVGKAFKNEKISAIGSINKYQSHYIIARKDKGIASLSDLKGKKIGIPLQTAAEFYLGRYLNLNGIRLDEITLVDQKPQQLTDSITKGDIDAVVIWEPYANTIKNNLEDNAVIWPAQSGQKAYWLIISNNDWIAHHPSTVQQFLSSLAQAEKYSVGHPTEAKAIVQKKLQYNATLLERIWPENQFALSLDQSLIMAMEDESRWMIQNNLTTTKMMPNYLDYIYTIGMSTVKPESMKIITMR